MPADRRRLRDEPRVLPVARRARTRPPASRPRTGAARAPPRSAARRRQGSPRRCSRAPSTRRPRRRCAAPRRLGAPRARRGPRASPARSAGRSAATGAAPRRPRPSASPDAAPSPDAGRAGSRRPGPDGEEVAEGLVAPHRRRRHQHRRPGARNDRERQVDRPPDRPDLGRGIERRAHLVVGDRRPEAARASRRPPAGARPSRPARAPAPCSRCRCRAGPPKRASCSGVGTSRNSTDGSPAKVSTSITAAEPVKSSPYQATSRPSGSAVIAGAGRAGSTASGARPSPPPRARRRAPRWHRRCRRARRASPPRAPTRSAGRSGSGRASPSIAWLTAERMRLPDSPARCTWKAMSARMKAAGSPSRSRCASISRRSSATSSGVGARRPDPHHAELEQPARLLEVLEVLRRRRQQHPRHRVALPQHRVRRQLVHPAALAVRDGDEPHRLQRLQRLAHRRAPDAVAVHELVLGGQRLAGADLAAQDQLLHPLEHQIGQLAPDDLFTAPVGAPGEGVDITARFRRI